MGYDNFEPMKKKNKGKKGRNEEFSDYNGNSKKGKRKRSNKRDDDKRYGF